MPVDWRVYFLVSEISHLFPGAANDRNPYGFQVSLVEPTPSFQEWYKKQEENRKFVKEVSGVCALLLKAL